jgi:CcmD family protein
MTEMIGDDKYFVVAMVMAIIFTGLGIYLFLIDRKLSRIEKKHEEKK